MKDVFLLDLDETLVDFEAAERKNFFETLSACGRAADEEVYGRFHAINDGLWKRLERGELARERLKVLRFELLFSEYGIAADAAFASSFYFKNFENICFPFAGAREFLEELSRRGRIYLVTNGGKEIQYAHVRMAGFGPYLSGVFISEEIGFDKPAEAFARYVESHIEGYDRSRAVWIGDSLTSDMVCAKSVGIDFILYAPRPGKRDFDGLVADNYNDLYRMLTAM